MKLNLVQFAGIDEIGALSKQFGDEAVIVAKDFSERELNEFNSKKRKSRVKLFSCKILSKKDSKDIRKFRKLADFVGARGGSIEAHSWAADQKLDLLLNPFSAHSTVFDLATANTLAERNVFTCFLFTDFLNARGFEKSQLMKNASLSLKLLEKASAPVMFVSGANSRDEMRSARNLSSFGVLLGMKKENAIRAVDRKSVV